MKSIRYSLLIVGALLTGCATSSDLHQARVHFNSGAPIEALRTLDKADVSQRDSLLLLLDRGAIAFSAGQYTLAKQSLLEAHELIETWDQIRVGEQSASLITSEWATRYRGEYSEQLWIHSYLMMTFLLLDDPESAAVEARRALKRLEAKPKSLHADWFTRALIGLSFEAAGAHDSAQVEYRKLVKDDAYYGLWNHVIQRHSKRIGRDPIPGVQSKSANTELNTPTQLARDEGELVVFLQSANIDQKLAGQLTLDLQLNIAFPYYPEFQDSRPRYTVQSDGESVPFDFIDTRLVDIARQSLTARGKTLAAKQVARIAAKSALVEATANENAALGGLVQILVFASEQADTRGWDTLPGWFGMVRVPLPVGEQEVVLNITHRNVDHRIDLGVVNIKPRGLHFATYRTDQPLPLRDGHPLDAPTNPKPASDSELDTVPEEAEPDTQS